MSEIPTALPTGEPAPKRRAVRRKTAAPEAAADAGPDPAAEPPVKRKPGRPRKTAAPAEPPAGASSGPAPAESPAAPAAPKRAARAARAKASTAESAAPQAPAAEAGPPAPAEPEAAPSPLRAPELRETAHQPSGEPASARPGQAAGQDQPLPEPEAQRPQPQGDDPQRGGHKQFKSRRFFKRGRFKIFKNRHGAEGYPDPRATQGAPAAGEEPSGGGVQAAGEPPPGQPVETFPCEGVLELSGKGFGFLRERGRAFQQHPQDVFVTPELVRRHGLRDGMMLGGRYRRGGRGPQMVALETINGGPPERFKIAPLFEELTALNPEKRIVLETVPERHTTRVIDLISPIGMGQRGLIVAPPRTGKTTLLMHIAEAVMANHPDVHLLVLLVDERPEEVTEFKINLPQAELWASSNDSDVKSHTRIAILCLERAKRMVEDGQNVFLILDSITRVGRAFNNAIQGTGRTLTGGMDARGMEIPRRLFAAARNTEEAGSLTIIATALIETGSRMDELIFQEFKGTGNMELVLDRRIAEQRIYPAVDIFKSGTRREELLVPEEQLEKISVIRRGLAGHKPVEAIERLLFFIRKFPTNKAMLEGIPG